MLEVETASEGVETERAVGERYLPAVKVMRRYSISEMSLARWLRNDEMNFPEPIYFNKRRYWRLADLVRWEREQTALSASQQGRSAP